MNSHNETFDKLFEELECFSPEIDESDLYVPPTHATFSQSSSTPLSNLNIRFLSQNVNKSNAITHSLLNSCGHNTDIFFIQEPWFDRVALIFRQVSTKLGYPTILNSIISYRISHQNTNQMSLHTSPNTTLAGPYNPDRTSSHICLSYCWKSLSNPIPFTQSTSTTRATQAL